MPESVTEILKKLLIGHEGVSLRPYQCPAGYLTIGVGHNLDAKPISERAAMVILEDDIQEVLDGLLKKWPWLADRPPQLLVILGDMAFNMGVEGLARFQRTLSAIVTESYPLAADEMLRSRWAQQVGRRAERLAQMMREVGNAVSS